MRQLKLISELDVTDVTLTSRFVEQLFCHTELVKKVRILVFAKDAKAEEAKAAGADFVGGEELIPKIQNEKLV